MTNDAQRLEQLIFDLEIRVTHNDKTITELNDVIAAQWKKIDGLERQLRRLDEELQALDVDAGQTHQKPPHY